jgi:hypothetical protein
VTALEPAFEIVQRLVTTQRALADGQGPGQPDDPTNEAHWFERCRPFFTSFTGDRALTRAAVTEQVEMAHNSSCDVLVCFAECEGLPLWPSDVATTSPLAAGIDVLAALSEETAAAGTRLVAAWMGVHCQGRLMGAHPSWLQQNAFGETIAAMCLNSPFGEMLRAMVLEAAGRYKLDGIYFDGLYARSGACWCRYCREIRHELSGVTAGPAKLEPEGARPPSHWLGFTRVAPEPPELAEFRRLTVISFLKRLRASVGGLVHPPKIVIDTLGVRDAFLSMGHDASEIGKYVDALLVEAYWDNRREPIEHIGIEVNLVRAESGRPVWWPRWLARHPDGVQVPVPEATVDAWVGQCFVHDASPVPVEQNLYHWDASLAAKVSEAMCRGGQLQACMTGTRRVTDVALVHSPDTNMALARHGAARDQYFDSFYGAYLALLEGHSSFEVVSARQIEDPAVLERFRAVVFPNTMELSETSTAAVAEFVQSGGGAVVTFRSGLGAGVVGAEGTPWHRFLGIEPLGLAVRKGRPGPEGWGGGPMVNFYRLSGSSPVVPAGLRGGRYSYAGPYIAIAGNGADHVVGRIADSDFSVMDGESFFAWEPGAESWPLALAGERGKGRLVYFACPLDAAFYREGFPESAELLLGAVNWVMNGSPSVSVEAPGCVDVAVHCSEGPTVDRAVVVIANRACNPRYALGVSHNQLEVPEGLRPSHPVRYLIEVPDVLVRVDLSGSGQTFPESLKVGGGGSGRLTRTADSVIEVRVDRVRDMEYVALAAS